MNFDLQKLRDEFVRLFDAEPRFFRASGRVNLIGEHTDYNDGFVLPIAIDRECVVAAGLRDDFLMKIHALDKGESETVDLKGEAIKYRGSWLDYVEGTIRILDETVDFKGGANIVFSSDVPLGAGLSSSAALEISHGFAILKLNEIEINRVKLALAAQRAEHEFVGAKVGIMDQFTSALGATNHALLIDCRSLEFEQIPLEFQNAKIVVVNSGVKHALANSEYNTRRQECEYAVECLREKMPEIKALRDVSAEDFTKYQTVMPEIIKRRARHIVTENARVLEAAQSLRNGDAQKFGALMYESHASMRDDYEISCDEIDFLVETARDAKGVFGARMTGGGFGGCTVNLVEENALEEFQTKITSAYQQQFKITPEIYIVTASDGASEIETTNTN